MVRGKTVGTSSNVVGALESEKQSALNRLENQDDYGHKAWKDYVNATILTIANFINRVTLNISISKRARENLWDRNQCRWFEGT